MGPRAEKTRRLNAGFTLTRVFPFRATEQFQERTVSYQQFSDNPSIIDDPNLVVKIGNKCVCLTRDSSDTMS